MTTYTVSTIADLDSAIEQVDRDGSGTGANTIAGGLELVFSGGTAIGVNVDSGTLRNRSHTTRTL